MGPRPSTGGRTSSSTSSGSSIGCFNGAPVSRRGGDRRQSAIQLFHTSFNGAPVSRRGGAEELAGIQNRINSFNGAPVSRRGGVTAQLVKVAADGSLQWG